MPKRLSYPVIGAIIFVLLEISIEGIGYLNPPEWFRPLWMILWILYQIILLPAHFALDFLTMLLGLPLLVKPTLSERGLLRISLLLGTDAIQGALIGWLFFFVKKRSSKK